MKNLKNNSEKGFALPLALLLLVVMTIMGATLVNITSTEHNANTNKDSNQQTFYAAESGISVAKNWMVGNISKFSSSPPNNLDGQLRFCRASFFPSLKYSSLFAMAGDDCSLFFDLENLTEKQKEFSDTLDLITNKPVLYVCNVDEGSALIGNNYVSQVKESIKKENSDLLILAVAIEADINELDNYDDRRAFLEDIGLSEAGSSKLIKKAYDLLNLQTYFTAGKKEVRAWTIHKGMTAPQAAGVIHTDFEKGFIRAEVISFNDYSEYKNEIKVKEAGKLKIEGKDYIVKDGDVMHFRFNV